MQAPDDDRIRATYAAFNDRGEFDTELFHPDVEWHNAPDWPGASVHRGIEAVAVKGKASGVPASMDAGHVLTIRGGKVARVQAFLNRADTLAAAGLER